MDVCWGFGYVGLVGMGREDLEEAWVNVEGARRVVHGADGLVDFVRVGWMHDVQVWVRVGGEGGGDGGEGCARGG